MGFFQGRGTAGTLIMMIVLTNLCVSKGVFATNYKVGDGSWDIRASYDTWLAGKTFKVGDTVEFVYTSAHNVVQVSKTDYDSCSQGSNSAKTDRDTTYNLSTSETYYFICSVPSHCESGMKIAIPVQAAMVISPVASPSPSAPTTPPTSSPSSSTPPTSPSTPTTNTTTSTPPGSAASPLLLHFSSPLLLSLGLSLFFTS